MGWGVKPHCLISYSQQRERNRHKIDHFIFFSDMKVRQRTELQVSLSPSTTLKIISSLICESETEKSVSEGTTKIRMRMQGERRALLCIRIFSSMTSSMSFSYFLLHSRTRTAGTAGLWHFEFYYSVTDFQVYICSAVCCTFLDCWFNSAALLTGNSLVSAEHTIINTEGFCQVA